MSRHWRLVTWLVLAQVGLGVGGPAARKAEAPTPVPANLAFVDVATSQSVLDQIHSAVAEFFSYDFRNLDEHERTIQEITTAKYWNEIAPTLTVVRDVAANRQVSTTAEVIATSLHSLAPGRAELLLFVNRSTTEAGGPPQLVSNSITVTAVQIGTTWKIDGMTVW